MPFHSMHDVRFICIFIYSKKSQRKKVWEENHTNYNANEDRETVVGYFSLFFSLFFAFNIVASQADYIHNPSNSLRLQSTVNGGVTSTRPKAFTSEIRIGPLKMWWNIIHFQFTYDVDTDRNCKRRCICPYCQHRSLMFFRCAFIWSFTTLVVYKASSNWIFKWVFLQQFSTISNSFF